MTTDLRRTRYPENIPDKKKSVGGKGLQNFADGKDTISTERGIQTNFACSPSGKEVVGGIRNQPLTEIDQDLADKIKKVTLKCAKLIHLGDTLDPSHAIGNDEIPSEIEMPSLLQGTQLYFANGDQIMSPGEKKELREIFKDFKSGVMLFTGPAGSGKTTLLKTIAREVLTDQKYEGLREVDIVLFLKCGDLNSNKRTTESKLLLSNIEPELSEDELKRFEKIASTNPEKILIMLDGLDTFPKYFYDRSVKRDVPRDSKHKRVYDIICELLKGRLYPQCRVIASSREMDFGYLEVAVSRSVYLDGLEEKSIYRIGKQFLAPKEAEKLMQMLESHPLLMNLCRTPMFLISILLGRRENPDFSPSKISENLLHLINRFVNSQHCQMKIYDIKRLKKLAFDLLKKNQFTFSSETLKDYGLDPEKVTGLIFRTGKKDQVMFFVHQFIHEMFASLHMADLEDSLFKTETNKCINLFNFFLTFRLLGGIVSNNSIFDQAVKFKLVTGDANLQKKRETLREILKKRVDICNNDIIPPLFILHVILILHECGDTVDDIIKQHLPRIQLKFPHPISLSTSDLLALASVAIKAQSLDNLTLSRCGLSHRHIDALSTFFEEENVKIQKMDFSQNELTSGAIKKTGSIVRFCKVEELNISATAGLRSTSPEHPLFSLKEALQDYKLKTLDISYNYMMLAENEMTEDKKEAKRELVYKLKNSSEVNNFEGFIAPEEITWNLQRPGLWKIASYDFLRSITNLIPNVTDKIVLYCWKFSPEWIKILKSNMKACGDKNLQIVLAKDCILKNSQPESRPDHFQFDSTPVIKEKQIKLAIASEVLTADIPKQETKASVMPGCLDKAQTGQKFQVLHRDKTKEDVKNFSEMLSKNHYLEEVELRECQVDSDFLLNLVKQAKSQGKVVHVKDFTVAAADDIDEMIPSICRFMKEFNTDGLSLEDCNGTQKMLKILHENLIKFQVPLERLDLSYNTDLQDFDELGRLVSDRLKELILVNCGLEMNSLECLQGKVRESKVRYLDISYNTELDEDSISLLPNILCKDKPVSLIIHGCELSEDTMDGFLEFKDIQIEKLDLSFNDTLESGGMAQVGRIVSQHQTRELILSSCSLDGECIDSFIDELEDCVMNKLDLSHNPGIAPHPQKVVQLLKRSGVQHLDVSNCKMTSKQIQHLADEMEQNNITLSHINLGDSHRRQVDEGYINAVRRLSEQVNRKFVLFLPGVSDKQKILLPQNERMVYGNEGMES